MGTGLEIIAVKFVEATAAQAELFSGSPRLEFLGSKRRQHVTNQRGGAAVRQLELFVFSSAERSKTGGRLSPRPPCRIYRFVLAPNKEDSKRRAVAGPPDSDLVGHKPPDRRSGRIPALPYPPLERRPDYQAECPLQEAQHKSPVLLARPVLLTTKCPALLTTAVRFCSHRDSRFQPCITFDCVSWQGSPPAGAAFYRTRVP